MILTAIFNLKSEESEDFEGGDEIMIAKSLLHLVDETVNRSNVIWPLASMNPIVKSLQYSLLNVPQ